jgi:hypothetical protein
MQDFWWIKWHWSMLFFDFCFSSFHHCSTLPHHCPPEICNSSDQTAHYHSSGLKFGASFLTQHLAGYSVRKLSFAWCITLREEHKKCMKTWALERYLTKERQSK